MKSIGIAPRARMTSGLAKGGLAVDIAPLHHRRQSRAGTPRTLRNRTDIIRGRPAETRMSGSAAARPKDLGEGCDAVSRGKLDDGGPEERA